MTQPIPLDALLTMQEVLKLTGYSSRSTIYRNVKNNKMPAPVILGGGRVRWRSSEIERWLAGLPTQSYC